MVLALIASLMIVGAIEDDAEFQTAKAGYQQMDLEGATAGFKALLDRKLSPADKATVWLWVGLCQADLGNFDDATAAFQEAMKSDPLVVVPPDASPRVQELINEARRTVRSQQGEEAPSTEGGSSTGPDAADPEQPSTSDEPDASGDGTGAPADAGASGGGSDVAEPEGGFPVLPVAVLGAGAAVAVVGLAVGLAGAGGAGAGWLVIGYAAGNADLSAVEATTMNGLGNQLYWGGWVVLGVAVVALAAGVITAAAGGVLALE